MYKLQMPGIWFAACILLAIPGVFIIAASIEYLRQVLFRHTIERHIQNIDTNIRLASLSGRTANILIAGTFAVIFGVLLYFKIIGS